MNMDIDGFDLDALAEMIDEEEDGIDTTSSCGSDLPISNDVLPTDKMNGAAVVMPEKMSTNNNSKPKLRQIKSLSEDIFSIETNNNSNDENANHNQSASDSSKALYLLDLDSSDDENKSYLTESGKQIKKQLTIKKSFEGKSQKPMIKTWKDKEQRSDRKRSLTASGANESYSVDEFSGIRIINPLVSHNFMQTRMAGRRMVKMSYIRNFMRNGDIEGDWVTIGVVVSKSPPKTSKNGKTFSIWKMTDLQDTEKLIGVFLFGTVHLEHWKTAVGTVVGILNPSFVPNKDGSNGISLSVDHPGKLMMMGTSKDFGHCKGKRRDGANCMSIINKSQCEFCSYHVSKEYKKLSSKRVELQASYSGARPNLKNKVLKGQNVMYGGQLFCNPSASTANTNSRKQNDKLRLNNLGLKRKAEELEKTERSLCTKKLSEVHGINIGKDIASNSKFINEQLVIPSVGSRNLFRHLVNKEKAEIVEKQAIVSVTPKELLKLHEQQLKMKRQKLERSKQLAAQNFSPQINKVLPTATGISPAGQIVPQIGRGLQPGDEISFDTISASKKAITPGELAKLRAINKIKSKGPIKQQDPNALRSEKTVESMSKIQAILEQNLKTVEDEDADDPPKADSVKKGLLGSIDLSSEKITEILNRKSSHAFEIEMEELEKQEIYFRTLEKKEQMEEKMLSTMEIVCDVVSCRTCRYTAFKATDHCKTENHAIKWHKAVKRFFACTNCKRRTYAFTKLPTRPCRNCGESSFERTSMMKPRSGPKLANETLQIRGDEIKFLNSLRS